MFSLNLLTFYSMVCALLPALVYMIVCRRRKGKVSYIWAMVFNLYVWLVYNVTGIGTLGDLINRPEGSIQKSVFQGTINLIPFAGVNISFLLNICMCIPLGFLLPFLWKAYRRISCTAALGAELSLLIELSQLITARATDIDDLIANTCGTLIGYGIWKIFIKIFGLHLKNPGKKKAEAVVYIGLCFLGIFFLYHPFWFAVHIAGY